MVIHSSFFVDYVSMSGMTAKLVYGMFHMTGNEALPTNVGDSRDAGKRNWIGMTLEIG